MPASNARLAPGAVELEQRLDLGAGRRHRPAIRARRERGEDLRAHGSLLGGRASACRRTSAGGSAYRRARRVERPGDRDLRDARRPRRARSRRRPRRRRAIADDGDADRVRTGRDRQPQLRLALQVDPLAVERDLEVVAPAR